jgi:hypothetical protein
MVTDGTWFAWSQRHGVPHHSWAFHKNANDVITLVCEDNVSCRSMFNLAATVDFAFRVLPVLAHALTPHFVLRRCSTTAGTSR